MNNQDISEFEKKLFQATHSPEPSPEFSNRLWAQIVEFDQQKSVNFPEPPMTFLSNLQALLSRKLFPLRRRQTGSVLLLVIMLISFFLVFATPSGRALAQSILHFFTNNTSDVIPAPTEVPLVWVEQTPGMPAATATPLPGPAFSDECGGYPDPKCTIEQIRTKVNFPIKELSVIPTPMKFTGATGGPDSIFIVYGTQDLSGSLILIEQPWTGSSWQTGWDIGASAAVETVKIGDVTGEYIKGSFTYFSGETQEHWDADSDTQVLRWVNNGIFFHLENFGEQLEKSKFIAITDGLTSEPVNVGAIPESGTIIPTAESYNPNEDYSLTVAEAEKISGFKITQPSKLPIFLSLLGASVDPEQKVVSIFYLRSQDMGPTTNGLLLKEEITPPTGKYYLSNFVIGDKTEVEKYSPGMIVGAIEEVQIGKITGQYVEGAWHGTDCCGWAWDSDPYLKRLRWQENGVAFELSYMGMDITKEDMIAIAVNMK